MRTKITKRNAWSVVNQIAKAMENATEIYNGIKIERVSHTTFERVTMTCSNDFLTLDVVERVIKHIHYFEDIYRTILMGVAVAMDDDGIGHPAIEVDLIF